ncbi:MAG: HlyD family efflux transporter periplasmic adaptor subunit, partial [Alphaproteobacteria bacterium]|nr:HlyD family efflux transporter periplasmic adaptor subunit [Alphaproteobacteria bacterium]
MRRGHRRFSTVSAGARHNRQADAVAGHFPRCIRQGIVAMWRWVAGVGALAAAVAVAVLLYFGDGGADGPAFRLAAADRGPVTAQVSATGTLGAVVTVQVGSQVSGQIAELLADYNTEVKAGQVVARIDPATFAARVRQTSAELAVARAGVVTATAAVARARAELQDVRTGLADAARDLERKRDLLRNGNVARAVVDTAEVLHAQSVSRVAAREAALQSAEAELMTARAQVERAEASLYANQIDLDRAVIRSPIDGVVVARNVDLGQTVAASLQAPVLFSIAQDLRKMQVEVSVDEADIGRIAAGQRAVFTVDAFTGREFAGRVEQVRLQPRIVQNVVTYTVVVTAANDDLRLLPGMTANARVIHDERATVLRVPNAALRWRPAGAGA